ncbi:hypothetical protein HGRIS_005967 [Hohenbuehelia grisea]|uniref:Kinetochore protein Sos7 coiled-coil domain-containing protein n=1 Tax=Hohenbuehelia grisea TaxID=104357 RepID=A0ABR3K0M1_9AGAR
MSSTTEHDQRLAAAQSLKASFDAKKTTLRTLQNVRTFTSPNRPEDDDDEISHSKDPAIIAADVAAQTSFLRKLKFQYLEQNAKDKYVKTIVSDIDDAPIVTADDNKALAASNEELKQQLKVAKTSLAESQDRIRQLAPEVDQQYRKAEKLTAYAADLSQKIIDTRLALTRLRQLHPKPRLTVPAADAKLAEQVIDMQSLNDELEDVQRQINVVKERVKGGMTHAEALRNQRAEAEQAVRRWQGERGEEDDGRLVPLYDWYTASLALHNKIFNLVESECVSENELRLVYDVEPSPPLPNTSKHRIALRIIFEPTTHRLASVQVTGARELGISDLALDEIVAAHVEKNDVRGVVASILSCAETRAAQVQ